MKKAVSVLIRLLERVIDPNGRNVQISWNILYLVDRLHIRAEKMIHTNVRYFQMVQKFHLTIFHLTTKRRKKKG